MKRAVRTLVIQEVLVRRFTKMVYKRGRNGYGYAGGWRNRKKNYTGLQFGTQRGRRPFSYFKGIGGNKGGAVARAVKKEFDKRVEWKHHVVNLPNALCSAVGVATDLSAVPQGQTDVTRIGDALRATSISMKWGVEANPAGATAVPVRIIVFTWIPNTTPTLASILNTTGGLETLAPYNTDNAELFKILFDKSIVVAANAGSTRHLTTQFNNRIVIPQHLRNIKFVAAGTTGSNKIWHLRLSNVAANQPNLDAVMRLNYSDS